MPDSDEKFTTKTTENWRIRIKKELLSAHEWANNWGFLSSDDVNPGKHPESENSHRREKTEHDILIESSRKLRVGSSQI